MRSPESDPGDVVRVRAVVVGRVQGVWFRESCRREAERLGVTGWVRNLRDGRVEFEAQGGRRAVDALLAWAHEGPRLAIIESVTVDALPVEGPITPATRTSPFAEAAPAGNRRLRRRRRAAERRGRQHRRRFQHLGRLRSIRTRGDPARRGKGVEPEVVAVGARGRAGTHDHPSRPKSLSASTACEGGVPRARPPTSGGNPVTTQWTKPSASGSRTTSATSGVPTGTPVHASGGETSLPTHVYSDGIG